MRRSRRAFLKAALVITVAAGATDCGATAPVAQPAEYAPAQREFPSFVYLNEASVTAYTAALDNPELFAQLACYCGCGSSLGHESLLSCFVRPDGELDAHAAGCGLCLVEALDANRQLMRGASVQAIRAGIDAQYARYGPPTGKAHVGS